MNNSKEGWEVEYEKEFGAIWMLWNTLVAHFSGLEKTIEVSPDKSIKSFISKTRQDAIREVLKEFEQELSDARAEHANIARYGNTPDDAYDKMENHLFYLSQKIKEKYGV